MCIQVLFSLWNGGLMDLSKTYKIDCIKKINALILKTVLARCDEDSRFYWCELFEELEHLFVKMVEKNSEGRRHLQFIVDREILGIVNNINNIQNKEEKHYKYLECRKHRTPQYYKSKMKREKKHKHKDSDDESSCSSDSDKD